MLKFGRHINALLLAILLLSSGGCRTTSPHSSEIPGVGPVRLPAREYEKMLRELDAAVDGRDLYLHEFMQKCDSLKDGLAAASTAEEKWRLENRLVRFYITHDIDSAELHVTRMADLARETGNKNWEMASVIARATTFHRKLEYDQTLLLLGTLDTSKMNRNCRSKYYEASLNLYRDILKYNTVPQEERPKYSNLLAIYRKAYFSGNYSDLTECRIKEGLYYNDMGEHEKAAHILFSLAEDTNIDIYDRSTGWFLLASSYPTGSPERRDCLLRASLIDASLSRRSHALYKLAKIIYEEGDHDRALNYMSVLVSEACQSNYRPLYLSSSEAQKVIVESVREHEARRKKTMLVSVVVISLAMMLVLMLLGFTLRSKRKLHSANARLSVLNEDLERLNTELNDSNQIKDEFLANYLKISVHYLYQVDALRKELRQADKQGGYEALKRMLRLPSYVDQESRNFYSSFDTNFRSLFPNFVEEVNRFFKPEDRLQLKADGAFSTNLRILALVRLGITSSQEQANILCCAIRTIYKYREGMKNRALCGPDAFESNIQNISK